MKKLKKLVFLFVVSIILIPNVNASIASDYVTYSNSLTTKTNVKGVLDELYTSLNQCKNGGDATASQILSGKKAYVKGTLITGTIENLGSVTINPGPSKQTISAGKYINTAITINGDAKLKAENIACGVTIFGITGTHACDYSVLKVGDYVMMRGSVTRFIDPENVLITSSSTVNFNTLDTTELDTWRVIKVYENGTVDVVSEKVTGIDITFLGLNGFLEYVAILNSIASLYENDYTIGSRAMGFAQSTESFYHNFDPSYDYSDTGYQTDVDLVQSALGTLKAKRASNGGTGSIYNTSDASYYLASRYDSRNVEGTKLGVRYVNGDGDTGTMDLYRKNDSSSSTTSSSYDRAASAAFRPILTLRAGATPSNGSGSKSDPWQF